MTFIDIFFRKKEDYQYETGNLKLKQDYIKFKKTVHLFLESDDDYEFYRHSLEEIYRKYKCFYYSQKGKKNVIRAFKEMDWNKYSNQRVLFLVDKDYDDIINRNSIKGSNFFKTEYYSIENYMVTGEILKTLLKRLYKTIDPGSLDLAVQKFNTAHKQFAWDMLLLTSCILIFRRGEEHMDLEGLKMEKIFYQDGMSLKKRKYLVHKTYQAIMKDPNIPSSDKGIYTSKKKLDLIAESSGADRLKIEYSSLISNLRLLQTVNNPKTTIRGKYELWFFFRFLDALEKTLISDLNKEIENYNRLVPENLKKPKHKGKFEINSKNAFDIICPKMDFPHDVKSFLYKNKRREVINEKLGLAVGVLEAISFDMRMKY